MEDSTTFSREWLALHIDIIPADVAELAPNHLTVTDQRRGIVQYISKPPSLLISRLAAPPITNATRHLRADDQAMEVRFDRVSEEFEIVVAKQHCKDRLDLQ